MIREIVLKEERNHRQHANEPTLERGTSRTEFVNDWLLHHDVTLTDALGTDNCPELKFLTGILVAPSTSKVQAPFLQDVIQADAAHMSFGKFISLSLPGLSGDANGTVIWHPTSLHHSQYVRFGGATNGQCITQQRVT
jgi:hypothetical protein